MLYWFKEELNPLEIDLIRYFQAGIEKLQGKTSLAIIHYTAIEESGLLDRELLDEVRLELAKLYIENRDFRTALEYLKGFPETMEILQLKFLIFRGIKDFQRAYKVVKKIVQESLDIRFWDSYISLSIRFGTPVNEIDISPLLEKLDSVERFTKFYLLFKQYRMEFQMGQLVDSSFQKGIILDEDFIDRAILIYTKLMRYNKLETLLKNVVAKLHKPKYLLALSDVEVELGEFEEALKLLDEVEEIEPKIGKIYIKRGDIFLLQKRYREARKEFFKALKFPRTRKRAMERLEMVKSYL